MLITKVVGETLGQLFIYSLHPWERKTYNTRHESYAQWWREPTPKTRNLKPIVKMNSYYQYAFFSSIAYFNSKYNCVGLKWVKKKLKESEFSIFRDENQVA
jgi:hypothetical protein